MSTSGGVGGRGPRGPLLPDWGTTPAKPLRTPVIPPAGTLKPIFYSVLTPIGPGAIKNAVFSRFLRRVVPQNKDCVRIALDFDDMGWR